MKSLPLALSISREERCEVLSCVRVVVTMYGYSLEERVFIVKTYWITGSIKNCQRRFVEQFGGRNPTLKRCIQLLVAACVSFSFRLHYLYLILSFRVANFFFANFQNTQPHFITGIKMYCTFVLFVNQHFLGLPPSGTHCIRLHLKGLVTPIAQSSLIAQSSAFYAIGTQRAIK
jgi:hypothetical protein